MSPVTIVCHRIGSCCRLGLVVLLLLSGAVALGQDFDPVEAAGDALRDGTELPWYDAEKDDVRAVPVTAPQQPPRPPDVEGISIEDEEKSPTKRSQVPVGGILQMLGWGVIAVLILVILVFIIYAVLYGTGRTVRIDRGITETHIDRVENLPFQVQRSRSDLLGEAKRQYEAGNYDEAIIYLYSYQLVQLDKHQLVRLQKGKTNRQYLWELHGYDVLKELVEETMIAFEDVFFGERHLLRERFEACWQRLDEFHQHVEPVAV